LHRTADADFADLINALSTNSELANVPSLCYYSESYMGCYHQPLL
jgi:hypothetical protein